jgi:hypothetical protein
MSKKLSKRSGKKRSTRSPAKKAKPARPKAAPMTSAERRSPARKLLPADAGPLWMALPGRTSMIWRRDEPGGQEHRQQNFDTPLNQPPLPVRLRDTDIRAFRNAEAAGALAATHFGPPKQDKTSNEDAALSASFMTAGRQYAFACVADGVSTKTFWPDRSSRLACLAAYRVFRRRTEDSDVLSPGWIDGVRHEIGPRLQAAFLADRARLEGVVSPPGWSESLYQRNREIDRYWYNTTLIAALVGETAGMVLWSGDGGILVEKTYADGRVTRTSLLESGDEMTVFNTPSLTGEVAFNGVRIDLADGVVQMRLMLFTDGVDRTLAREGDRWAWMGARKASAHGRDFHALLSGLAVSPDAEFDNMSVASMSWPMTAIPAGTKRGEVLAALAELDGGTTAAIQRLSVIAHRWPRAVATLLLRACDRDPLLATEAATKLGVGVNIPLNQLASAINELVASPRDLAREEDDLRQLRTSLRDV